MSTVTRNAKASQLASYLPLAGGTMAGNINFSNLTASRVLTTDGSKNGASSSVTTTELGYLSGATSAIQTQLDSKATGSLSNYLPLAGGTMAGNINFSNLTASRVLTTDGSKNGASSSVTTTELGYLSGVTSAIQTQITNATNAVTLWDQNASSPTLPDATGNNAVAIGSASDATATNSFAVNGGQAIAANATAIGAGAQARASGAVAIGLSAYADASGVVALGNGLSDQSGCLAFAGAALHPVSAGTAVSAIKKIYSAETTDATQTEMNPSNRFSVTHLGVTSVTWAFTALFVARRTDADNESAAYRIDGCIDRFGSTTALVGAITKTVIAEDTAAWDVTAEADDANDALVFKVTGEAGKNISWSAVVDLIPVFET